MRSIEAVYRNLTVRVALTAAIALIGMAVRPGNPVAAPPQVEALVEGILASYDSPTPLDLSPESFAKELAQTKAFLAELREIDASTLSPDDALDRRFLESLLIGRELVEARMRFWRMDPRVYMRSFQTVAAALGSEGDEAARADILLRALQSIPIQLRQGQKNLSLHVPRFQELSALMAQEAATLFTTDVPAFAESFPQQKQALIAANSAARRAYDDWVTFLKIGMPKRPPGYFAIGIETYDAMLKTQSLLAYDSDSLYKYTRDEFYDTTGEIEELAAKIDPNKAWPEILDDLKHLGPDPTKEPPKEIELRQERIDKARAHILSKHLIAIPWKERVEVVSLAKYLRRTTAYGHFSSAASRLPAPDGTLVGEWQIDPFDPKSDDKTKPAYLLDRDFGTIALLAAHETYGGRHVQALYQMHNPRKVRRALGSALFTEGWALYNEQLMQETGLFPDERVHLLQLQRRLLQIARAMADVGIHTRRMTYAEAIAIMTDEVGLSTAAATPEVDALMAAPGAGMHDFIGMIEIRKMRGEFERATGARFSLSDFHERLLKVGAMPPALMREALRMQ